MKIVAICGSPRKGSTEFMLRTILDSVSGAETELILLKENKIEFCDGCLTCGDSSECHIQDDMQSIYSKLLDTDLIIFGSPNYYNNITGMMKNFIDRTNPFYDQKKLKGKKAIIIGVGELSGKEPVDMIKDFCEIHGMEVLKVISIKESECKDNVDMFKSLGESIVK